MIELPRREVWEEVRKLGGNESIIFRKIESDFSGRVLLAIVMDIFLSGKGKHTQGLFLAL